MRASGESLDQFLFFEEDVQAYFLSIPFAQGRDSRGVPLCIIAHRGTFDRHNS